MKTSARNCVQGISQVGPSAKQASVKGILTAALFAALAFTNVGRVAPANHTGVASSGAVSSDTAPIEKVQTVSAAPAKEPGRVIRARVAENYGKLPLSFEPNVGQGKSQDARQVQFLSRGNGYALLLDPQGVRLRLRRHPVRQRMARRRRPSAAGSVTVAANPDPEAMLLDMRLVGANPAPKAVGLEELPGKVNYLRGSDPKQWRTNVPTYAKVSLASVYPGIDLVYYGNQRQLEYDFVVAPGADPNTIRLNVTSDARGDAKPRIDETGDLVVAGGSGEVRFHKPELYQMAANSSSRTPVDGQFALIGDDVAFQVAPYDRSKPLVIDPKLVYSTFVGGSNVEDDDTNPTVAVDSAGNAYMAGETDSTDFPVLNAFQSTHASGDDSDATLTKLNSTGTALVYSTYLGGTGGDWATGIQVDSTGAAYVVGTTCSSDFPVTPGAFQTAFAGPACVSVEAPGDAYVTKFAPSGSSLEFSTYFGGSGVEVSGGIAIDSAGNSYFTGSTLSTDLPVTAGVVQPTYHGAGPLGIGDAFVAKLNPTGTALVYSTYLGGSGDDWGTGIAVDAAGNAYVCGETNSTDFPVTAKAFQKVYGGTDPDNYGDAWVAKLNGNATALTYSTYLGGKDDEGADAIAVDKTGHAYVTGATNSTNFPVTPTAFQVVYGGAGPADYGDIFVAKLNPKGSALTYSTYVGADADEIGVSIALDSTNGAWVVGWTTSPDFPTTPKALQRIYGGAGADGYGDAFVLRVSPNGSALTFSTFMGSTNDDYATGVAVDSTGAYVVGATSSPNFPVTPGAYKTSCGTDGNCNGTYDAFILKIKP